MLYCPTGGSSYSTMRVTETIHLINIRKALTLVYVDSWFSDLSARVYLVCLGLSVEMLDSI